MFFLSYYLHCSVYRLFLLVFFLFFFCVWLGFGSRAGSSCMQYIYLLIESSAEWRFCALVLQKYAASPFQAVSRSAFVSFPSPLPSETSPYAPVSPLTRPSSCSPTLLFFSPVRFEGVRYCIVKVVVSLFERTHTKAQREYEIPTNRLWLGTPKSGAFP